MITAEQSQFAFAVCEAIGKALQQMGFDETIYNCACVDINAGCGHTKQADMALGPRTTPRSYPKRLVVVLDVGTSVIYSDQS
jgi:hypothetical protein